MFDPRNYYSRNIGTHHTHRLLLHYTPCLMMPYKYPGWLDNHTETQKILEHTDIFHIHIDHYHYMCY